MIYRCGGSRYRNANAYNNFLRTIYEKEFPPLSANKIYVQPERRLNLIPCSKLKSEAVPNSSPLQHEAANLITSPEQELKVTLNIGSLQCEASTSESDLYDTDLPAGFWKKKPLSFTGNAVRVFSEFQIPRHCKRINRCVGSRADGNSVKTHNNFLSSSTNYEKEFPPLPPSKIHVHPERRINLIPCSRLKSDGVMQHETSNLSTGQELKLALSIGPLQCVASTLESDLYDTDLPAGFGKKKTLSCKNLKFQHRASHLSSNPKQESKVASNIDPLQCETSTSTSNHYDTDLPTKFGKKLKVALNIGPLQYDASTSISDKCDREKNFPPLSVIKNNVQRERISPVSPLQHDASNFSSSPKQESKVAPNIDPLQSDASTSTNDKYDTDLPPNFGKKLKVALNIGPLQSNASTSISDQYDRDLPTIFGKKRPLSSSENQNLHLTRNEHREAKKRSKSSSITPIDEPFDICPPETTESTSPRSYVNQRNSGIWVPKEHSAEENEQNKGDTEKGNNTEGLDEEPGLLLRPGMVLLKHYIPLSEQVNIVNRCRDLGCGPGGFYRPGYNDGAELRLYMTCLGLDWNPQTKVYRKKHQHDNVLPSELPHEFTSLVSRVLDDSHTLIKRDTNVSNVEDVLPTMHPDVCIVNFYSTNGRLGLHQDRDESQESLDKGLPVVSISIGDSAEFLYGDERDVNMAESVLLESGDVLIFGGEARHIYHGVKTIIPDSAPSALLESTKLRPGRLNLTFKKY